MDLIEIKNIVKNINQFIQKHFWLDFEVIQYNKNKLTIIGSIDISDTPIIKIIFEDIFFVSLPITWKTDTSSIVLFVLEGEKAYSFNMEFQVEQGYTLFAFTPEDYPMGFYCLVGAKKISYRLM